jgi:hypothetical protein
VHATQNVRAIPQLTELRRVLVDEHPALRDAAEQSLGMLNRSQRTR